MNADGTQLRRLGAIDDVNAVTALPNLYLALLEDLYSLNILQQRTAVLLMVHLDSRS